MHSELEGEEDLIYFMSIPSGDLIADVSWEICCDSPCSSDLWL